MSRCPRCYQKFREPPVMTDLRKFPFMKLLNPKFKNKGRRYSFPLCRECYAELKHGKERQTEVLR